MESDGAAVFKFCSTQLGEKLEKKKISKYYFLKSPLTKLHFNGSFNAQMDKGITSVIELYQTPSQRPSLKTL